MATIHAFGYVRGTFFPQGKDSFVVQRVLFIIVVRLAGLILRSIKTSHARSNIETLCIEAIKNGYDSCIWVCFTRRSRFLCIKFQCLTWRGTFFPQGKDSFVVQRVLFIIVVLEATNETTEASVTQCEFMLRRISPANLTTMIKS
jgi:hypothetical protein